VTPEARLPADFVRFEKTDIEQSISSRFEQMVGRYPERLAVRAGSVAYTYAELDGTANRIAHALLDGGGRGPEPVALMLEHGPPFLQAVLGVLKAGKFYVPIDTALPPARAADMLADLESRLILTNGANAEAARRLAADGARVIDIDALGETPGTRPDVDASPGDIAYIIYTSGSTGQPKGVVVEHRTALHNAMNYTNGVHYSKDDRISWLNALSTNAAATDFFPALLNGAAVFPFPVREMGVERLARWLDEEAITSYGSVPLIFRLLASTLSGGELFPHLRLIRLGGDRLLRSDVELYRKHFSSRCVLRNGLGSAEVLLIRQHLLDRDSAVTTHVVDVGYPLEDVEVLILGDDGQPRAAGEVGEIAVKSRHMARGYWRRPDLTAARFLVAPDGERIYLTGDLGRLAPDGCLTYLERVDFQVKIRGKLIAPVEVETALLDVPGIRHAAVVAREDAKGETRLVAYFVPDRAPGPSVGALRRALAATLSSEMIPSAFVALDEMPLTGNNKVDRNALPPPALTRPAIDTAFVAPRTPIEQALVGLWAEALKLPEIGVYDDFFELGGDSLIATQVATRVIDRFGLQLPASALLEAPTVAAMADLVTVQLLTE
jgi:amino acid adenylation domain-containing protein